MIIILVVMTIKFLCLVSELVPLQFQIFSGGQLQILPKAAFYIQPPEIKGRISELCIVVYRDKFMNHLFN